MPLTSLPQAEVRGRDILARHNQSEVTYPSPVSHCYGTSPVQKSLWSGRYEGVSD